MNSLVLAFDTATEVTAVAVGRRGVEGFDVLASCDTEAPRAAMSRLLPCVEDLASALGIAPTDLDEVVVGRGPGSFTGVRIGVATAKGIAQGLGVPLYGVGTLDAIAWRIAGDEPGLGQDPGASAGFVLGVVGDAMRGEVYPARFRIADGSAERLDPDAVAKPEAVVAEWADAGETLVLAGNGLRKYGGLFAEGLGDLATLAPPGRWAPSGVGLLWAFSAALERGNAGSGDPGTLLPLYTRLSDAEEAERDRPAGGTRSRSGGPSATPATGVRGPGADASGGALGGDRG